MRIETIEHMTHNVLHIQRMLLKIDQLHLPSSSRRDLEGLLVRQVARELDRLLPWQAGHAETTEAVAIHIAQAMQVDDRTLHQLTLAALLHDVGLLGLPFHLQNGSEPLDHDSYVAIQSHPRLAVTLLEPFSFLRGATIMIAHHHEHWDGGGYPYGLRGTFIPLGARILAVADAFDAIRVPGVIQRSRRDHIALRILRVASGTQFDPSIIDILCRLIEKSDAPLRAHAHNDLRGKPASAQRRFQSGTPTAPTEPAEAFASRRPQPPLSNPESSGHQLAPPAGSLVEEGTAAHGKNSITDHYPLPTPPI